MNAVEIEQAVTELADQPFDRVEFPFAFLAAFGNKETTIRRLRAGASNKSDLGGVLQTNNLHILVADSGEVTRSLQALKISPATTRAKAQFIVATDGVTFEAEDLTSGETIACEFQNFPDHFGFFLPLAGISTVKQIRESSFDIRATSRLNRLYIELLKDNPEWGSAERRHDLNHFVARLIFCFFAEDTGIFSGNRLFTTTVDQMSERDSSNTHLIIGEMFRAMNTDRDKRSEAKIPRWADAFPYVNGGLFSGSVDAPVFSKISRSYLLHIGSLDWTKINPDIFGSMIQAVADDEERGELGMHYTSVPNILKVLNPLFLDDLRTQIEQAGDNPRALLNLRKRIVKIRVFDPACGSGNFLVIAYKQVREIENTINERRGEAGRKTDIPLTNYRGIEIRDFSCEVARLALVIAEYQCDLEYLGQKEALAVFLPLDSQNWITCGNALRLDWLSICPPTGTGVKLVSDDLFNTPLDQAQIDFENEGGETFICGNPPFKGARKQSKVQKQDMEYVFCGGNAYKDCDYVTAWYIKASQYSKINPTDFAFVSTNSIARGEQVEHLWSILYANGESIRFCHTQFKWQNNAQNNAGVWCVIIGLTRDKKKTRFIIADEIRREVSTISPYLISGAEDYVRKIEFPLSKDLCKLVSGNMARDDGNLILDPQEMRDLVNMHPVSLRFLRPLIGTTEIRNGSRRWCLWIKDDEQEVALKIEPLKERVEKVRIFRANSTAKTTIAYSKIPHRFAQRCHQEKMSIVLPKNTMEGIKYLTPDVCPPSTIATDLAFVTFTEDLSILAILSSTLHRVWAEAISGGLGSGIRYSSQITYNAFPIPTLTDNQKMQLTTCATDILISREQAYSASISEMYDPEETMPANLREAHERNDETLERIYIGRRFRNDTERLEKLFELYTKMTAAKSATKK